MSEHSDEPSIIHVDMDAFFASVEQRDSPELAGKPVIVGGTVEGRGVVSAASYEARKFGIHSAMPMAQAVRLCPDGAYLPVRMSRYVEVSRAINVIFRQFSPLVERVSVDEAFLDVAGCERLYGDAVRIARAIKNRIRQRENLTASVGVAHTKFLAKLASDLEKPDGFVIITPDNLAARVWPLDVGKLWGVGPAMRRALGRIGIKTIGQLAAMPDKVLDDAVGQMGRELKDMACGSDRGVVTCESEAKSVSTETTFPQDVSNRDVLVGVLAELADEVAARLRASRVYARTITLKARLGDFTTFTRSRTLERATNTTQTVFDTVRELLENEHWASRPIRLLGVGASKLSADAAIQLGLFDRTDAKKQTRIDRAADVLKDRFGRRIIRRGSELDPGEK